MNISIAPLHMYKRPKVIKHCKICGKVIVRKLDRSIYCIECSKKIIKRKVKG
jgi:hypothetical protein